MQIVEVIAGPQNLKEFRECAAPCRPRGFVRCQVARHNVRSTRHQRAKVAATSQVGSLIDDLRLAEVLVPAPHEFRLWARAVATIALTYGIDQIAAEPHQLVVRMAQIQRDRGNLESSA